VSDRFHCLCCGHGAAAWVHRACPDYYLGTPFLADYVRCDACGLVQQWPVPADVSVFYANYPVHARKSSSFDAVRRVLTARVYYRPPARVTRLLDYGCGDGGYMARVRRPGLEVVGLEADRERAAALTAQLGMPVVADADELLRRYGPTFDVVTMHAVLEHLTDLHGTFDLVSRLLRPGGTFYFMVPQASAPEARLFGRRWHGLDPPRHISFPEPPVVRRLADRHGFRVVRHAAVPFPTGFAGSVAQAFLGRFSFAVMAAVLPITMAFTLISPGGFRAFTLERRTPRVGTDAPV
jgi:SAM-dependent methyltransferase